MKRIDSLFILEKDVYFNSSSPFPFCHPCGVWISGKPECITESRYVIYGHEGVEYLPSRAYKNYISDSGIVFPNAKKTREYKREVDETYFKYYDDAEEVLENIKALINWLDSLRLRNLKKKAQKKTSSKQKPTPGTDHVWTREIAVTSDWARLKNSMNGCAVRRRSDLSPLMRDLADEQDLKEQD